ncbi:hypothetical protein J6590_094135 [Homalodisca vitripennis]|nr:hypothetical protein J6590_094135 [Homalodisca vitripennis]
MFLLSKCPGQLLYLIVSGKEVIKGWGNLRDAFSKSKKKLAECEKSGASAHNIRKYIYADQMQFLNKLYQSREVAESLEVRTDNNEDKAENNLPEAQLLPKKPTLSKPRENKRRRQPDEVELKMIKALEEQSPRISFIQGFVPHLHKFDDSEILEFQMGDLEVINIINNKRKHTAQPQLLPQQKSSYYPNNYPFPQYQSYSNHNHPKFINSTKIEINIHKLPITVIQTTSSDSKHALRKDSHLQHQQQTTITILSRFWPHVSNHISRELSIGEPFSS